MSRCQYALKTNRTYPKAKLGGKVLVKLWIENHIPLGDAIYREARFASRTYPFQFTFWLLSVVYKGFEVWMIEEVAENLSGSVLKMSDSKSAMLRNLCTWWMYCCWGGILQRHISNRCHTMVPERGSKWTQSGSKGTKGLAYLGDQVFWCLDSYNHETWIWLCSIIANSFSEESHTTV